MNHLKHHKFKKIAVLRKQLRTKKLMKFYLGMTMYFLIILFFSFLLYEKTVLNKRIVSNIQSFYAQPLIIEFPVRYEISHDMGCEMKVYKNMTITAYTNRKEETDNTPNHTATGRLVYEGSCAVSQDLFRKQIFPGDIVYVEKLNRFFIVEDTMNPRHSNHIDIFVYKRRKKDGSFPKELKQSLTSNVIVIRTNK